MNNLTFTPNSKETFPGQYPDEAILLVTHRHPIALFSIAAYLTIMLLLPILIYFSATGFLQISFSEEIASKISVFLLGLYLLYLNAITFFLIIDFYLDIWIITNQRIMSIEQKGLFRRNITETRYNRIQDITSIVPGFLATYFQYGDILIQTAGENERLTLRQIPNPIETRRIIAEACKKAADSKEYQNL